MTSLPQPPSALGQTLSFTSASSEGTTQELVRVGTKCLLVSGACYLGQSAALSKNWRLDQYRNHFPTY